MFGGYSFPGAFGYDTALTANGLIGSGNWVFLWKGGFALSDLPQRREGGADRRVLPLHGRLHGHDGDDPDRRDGRAVEVEGVRRLGPLLRRASTTRCSAPGRGAAAGWPSSATACSSASATSTSPVPASCTPSVASPALAGALVLGPRIGKFGKDGKPRAMPGHNIPMAMLGTFILLFGWFGFNAASTFAATDVRFAMVAANTAIAAAFGATVAMFWVMWRIGQARPGHDGERHARRSRGDHGAVCVRRAVGGGGDRIDRRRARHRVDRRSSRSAASTTRWVRSPSTASTASGACSPSGCSRAVQYGAGWNLHDEGCGGDGERRDRHPLRRRASAPVSSARRRSVRS